MRPEMGWTAGLFVYDDNVVVLSGLLISALVSFCD
jgi:hypothetical protein